MEWKEESRKKGRCAFGNTVKPTSHECLEASHSEALRRCESLLSNRACLFDEYHGCLNKIRNDCHSAIHLYYSEARYCDAPWNNEQEGLNNSTGQIITLQWSTQRWRFCGCKMEYRPDQLLHVSKFTTAFAWRKFLKKVCEERFWRKFLKKVCEENYWRKLVEKVGGEDSQGRFAELRMGPGCF